MLLTTFAGETLLLGIRYIGVLPWNMPQIGCESAKIAQALASSVPAETDQLPKISQQTEGGADERKWKKWMVRMREGAKRKESSWVNDSAALPVFFGVASHTRRTAGNPPQAVQKSVVTFLRWLLKTCIAVFQVAPIYPIQH
jgi:hypothetical protein